LFLVATQFGRLSAFLSFRACGEQFYQHGVAYVYELFNGAAAEFPQNAIVIVLLDLGGKFSEGAEIFLPGR
jgi:hypothetical protein